MTVNRLDTPHLPWLPVGVIDATAGAADAALGATERLFSTAVALANGVGINGIAEGINSIEVLFTSTTNNDDAVVDVWAARKGSDDLKRVCTITIIIGAQTDGTNFFADTLTLSNTAGWAKTIISAIATDQFGTVQFDIIGYDKILFHGHTTVDGDITVEYSGF